MICHKAILDMLHVNHKPVISMRTIEAHLKKLLYQKSNVITQSVIFHSICPFSSFYHVSFF